MCVTISVGIWLEIDFKCDDFWELGLNVYHEVIKSNNSKNKIMLMILVTSMRKHVTGNWITSQSLLPGAISGTCLCEHTLYKGKSAIDSEVQV